MWWLVGISGCLHTPTDILVRSKKPYIWWIREINKTQFWLILIMHEEPVYGVVPKLCVLTGFSLFFSNQTSILSLQLYCYLILLAGCKSISKMSCTFRIILCYHKPGARERGEPLPAPENTNSRIGQHSQINLLSRHSNWATQYYRATRVQLFL